MIRALACIFCRADAIWWTVAGLLMAVGVAIAWTLVRAGSESRCEICGVRVGSFDPRTQVVQMCTRCCDDAVGMAKGGAR